MRLGLLLPLLAPLPALAQDGPGEDRITLEAKGRFSAVVERFERATGCRVPLDPAVEDREVDVAVRNAGFFEALDALCRAHGDAGYLERPFNPDRFEPALPLLPGAWRDYPASSSGDFKVSVLHFLRERVRSDRGDSARVRLHVGVFTPPHLPPTRPGQVEWSLTEVRDADGKDVLPPRGERPLGPRIQLSTSFDRSHRFQGTALDLSDFDLDRGLSLLKGEASFRVFAGEEVRVPLEAGRTVESPGGTLDVRSMEPLGPGGWKIVLEGDPDRFLGRARVHRLDGWCVLAPGERGTIEARTPPLAAKPEWITLRARGKGLPVQVPFELKDVRFGKK